MSRALFGCVSVLAFLLLGPLAHGGGSRADYVRANRSRDELRDTVLNEKIALTWVGSETAVYRRQIDVGAWRWMHLDVAAGTRVAAFDHERVAKRLEELLGRPQAEDRLELTPFGFDAGSLRVLCGAHALSVDLETSACEALDLVGVDELRLPVVEATESRGGGHETAILFVNTREDPVEVSWLDHQGEAHAYATVAPGGRHRQHTFAGHAWRVADGTGNTLSTYRARKTVGVALIEAAASEPRPAEPRQPASGPGVSPDGRWRVFIEDHDVHLEDRHGGGTRQLTSDGDPTDRYVGRWSWSPTSRTLMVVREQPADRHRVHAVDSVPADRLEPRLRSWNYLKAGDRIAVPRPHLFDVVAGTRIDLPEDRFSTPWAIHHFSWAPEGERFRFLYNERGHQVLRFLELDATDTSVRTILEERSETFIDYSQKTLLSPVGDSDAWLWMSERSGTNHLYRLDAATGGLRAITTGPWVVRRVLDSETEGGILFEALGVYPDQDPYHVHVGRVGADGSGLVWLTEGDGTHSLDFTPEGAHYVDTFSRVDLPPIHELRRTADGSLICVLEKADWTALLATGWRPPERFTAKGRDGKTDIFGVLFKPSTFDPKSSYPVVESIYAGPHGHFVPKRFSIEHEGRRTAELGFVVARIDGMGTNWRSKAFHDVCWKNLADAGFPDRVRWLRAAAKDRPWMDLTRVGIYGGSAGGQSAMRALIAHSDTYHVAVADCGCHDNRMDKIWWNEAWMGWPVGPHYEEQSNVTQAHRLEGRLLLIVGEVDRNVDPASTMQVVDALVRADKDFDLLVLPGVGHGAAGTPYGRRRLRDYLVRHLLGVEPRWE